MMTELTTGAAVAGLIVGAVTVWLIAYFRWSRRQSAMERHYTEELSREEARATGAEAVQCELREQISRKESEIARVREQLSEAEQEKVRALTELRSSMKNLEEQKDIIEKMKKDLTDTFNALSSAALKSSSEDLLRLASERFDGILKDTKGKLGEHQTAMSGLVRPLQEALKKYEEQINAMEAKRRQDYGGIEEHIRILAMTHQQLQKETSNLVTALRKPQVSGSWGQLSLKRAAELAGMTAHCDFYEEVSVGTETGRLRPDMVVRLPNGREIVVDAKAPVDAYLKAISEPVEDARGRDLRQYVKQVRTHMNSLGSKAYWDQFSKSPEMVVMYLPGESFFSAAIEHDHKLIEDSSQKKVVLATPTTFIALLKAVAYGWQQEQITENAQQVSRLGKELYDRIQSLVKHFEMIGSSLGRAIDAYNKVIGSLEARVLPSVRKFRELGVAGGEEIDTLERLDKTARNLNLISTTSHKQEIL